MAALCWYQRKWALKVEGGTRESGFVPEVFTYEKKWLVFSHCWRIYHTWVSSWRLLNHVVEQFKKNIPKRFKHFTLVHFSDESKAEFYQKSDLIHVPTQWKASMDQIKVGQSSAQDLPLASEVSHDSCLSVAPVKSGRRSLVCPFICLYDEMWPGLVKSSATAASTPPTSSFTSCNVFFWPRLIPALAQPRCLFPVMGHKLPIEMIQTGRSQDGYATIPPSTLSDANAFQPTTITLSDQF